ncbi:hypothetical protein K5549_021778, partial [Capra hircus]
MLCGALGKTFWLYSCIAHGAFEYVGSVVMCFEPSMKPTIQNSDTVFAESLNRHFYGIQRDDIVITKSPSDPKSHICKRVIGLEEDKILTSSPADFFKRHCLV